MGNIMSEQELHDLIQQSFSGANVAVSGDGRHFELRVISQDFADKSTVKRQQMVYGLVQDYIVSGKLHALNIQALTPTEWEQANG